MSNFPSHRGIDAIYRPLGEDAIEIKGNWAEAGKRFGVLSENHDAVFAAYQRSSDRMLAAKQLFCGELEVSGETYNVFNVIKGKHYHTIIITLA